MSTMTYEVSRIFLMQFETPSRQSFWCNCLELAGFGKTIYDGWNIVQVWGPLIFESRRFVELRQKSLWKQITSAESTGMGLFYTLNIVVIQVASQNDYSCDTRLYNSKQSYLLAHNKALLFIPNVKSVRTWLADLQVNTDTLQSFNVQGS